jgi:exodeoxyribonuclease VII large subunit
MTFTDTLDAHLAGTPNFSDVTPGTFQQFTALLIEQLATSQLPKMGGMIRLHGRWTDPGWPAGKFFYGGKVVDDGGAQAKVEILSSLVSGRGIVPGQMVVLTGRLIVRTGNYGVEVKLAASDIHLDGNEETKESAGFATQGRMTLDRLRTLPLLHFPFPEEDVLRLTLIRSKSAQAQVAHDCMAEINRLGDGVQVKQVAINMLDPVAIAEAIQQAEEGGVIVLIRGGGDASDFEVFDDPRVVAALARKQSHRVLGLGHTGNSTLLDLMADYSANTPAQAGAYVRETVQNRQRELGEAAKEVVTLKGRLQAMEKDHEAIIWQLKKARDLMASGKRIPTWVAIAAFVGGVVLAQMFR